MSNVAVVNDYVGLVAIDGRNRFLVDEVQTIDGIVSIYGPSIKRDGSLAKTVRVGTYPQFCTFEAWKQP